MRRFGAMLTVLLLCCAFPAHAMTVSVDYEASEAELVNPFIGNAVWANDLSETSQPFTLVYANLRWADFEREEGVFDFDSFESENNFSFWREQGKHLILRFVMDIPTSKKHRDIPDWLYERTAGDGKAYSTDYGKGYSPNYENPLLIEAHARVIEALGARYDRDSFVAYVELGSLGHWGEWHVHDKAGVMPDEAIREQYVLPYVKVFFNTPLMMRRPFRAAKVYGMGLYNDTSADPDDTEEWLSWIEDGGTYDQTQEQSALVPMANAWQTAPIGGELATDRKETALLAENLEETLSLFSASHSSWIGPRSFAKAVQRGDELQSAYDQLSRLLGYRLRISRVALTDGVFPTLTITWTNDGIAPFYFPWQPCLRLTADSGEKQILPLPLSLMDILPGIEVTTSVSLPQGGLLVEAGIVNPESGQAEIALAMNTPQQDNWYHLLSIKP